MKNINPKNIENILALTPMQEGMLFHYLKDPESDYYFEQLTLQISGAIDAERFEKAWNFVIETNEMLRAVFRWEKIETPIQIILKEHILHPGYYDLSGLDANEKKKKSEEIKSKDREKKLDLREVPFRVTLCRIGKDKYEMIISNHHILYDGWSNGIILKEFFNAYDYLSGGKPVTGAVKTPFKEFVKGIRSRDIEKEEKFWEDYLRGDDAGPGSSIKRRSKEIKNTGTYRLKFPDETHKQLKEFAGRRKITSSPVFYCTWAILLQKLNPGSDVLFDTTVSGRSVKIKGIEDIVGLFINTLPVRISFRADEKISGFVSRMHHMLQELEEFANSSRLIIEEKLDKYYRETLFDPVFVIENYPLKKSMMGEKGGLRVDSFSILERTRYDLTIIITIFDDIELSVTYNERLFDEETVKKLFGNFLFILAEILESPQKKVSAAAASVKVEGEKNRIRRNKECSAESGPMGEYVGPGNPVEEKLVEIWSQVLRVDKAGIGIDHNFFDFGGHSLKASLMAARIHRAFHVKVPLAEIFQRPTVRELAGYIQTAGEDRHLSIEAVESKDYYPVSAVQGRMYALQKMDPASTAYNVSSVIVVEGLIESERRQAFEKAFEKMFRRHESLRTSIRLIHGEPVQRIHPPGEFKIDYYDAETGEGSETGIIKDFIRPFDLANPPLMRIGLVQTGKERHLLLFDAHHIVSDGTSMNLFIKEWMAFYRGEEVALPLIRYKDFAEWQNRRSRGKMLKVQESWWLKRFSGELPALKLPTDFPRTPERIASSRGDTLDFAVSKELCEKIRVLEKESSATLYMILLAATNVLLMKYTGQEDIVVGSLTDGRSHLDLQTVVGAFIATLAMRNFPNREKSFRDFLQEVKTDTLKAFENSDYQFEELLKNIRVRREGSRNPLFDTMFLLQNYDWTELSIEGPVFRPYPFQSGTSTVELRVTAVESQSGIDIEVQYASRLFKKSTIRRLSGHYIKILEEVTGDAGKKLAEIAILTEEEKKKILLDVNAMDGDVGEIKPVFRLFEDRVRKTPAAPAAVYRGELMDYRTLNGRINRLARYLRKQGIQGGQAVGILLPPSLALVESLFAVWKAGGVYMPIDPRYPARRIIEILTGSSAAALLCRGENDYPGLGKNWQGEIIRLDRRAAGINEESAANPGVGVAPNDLAYIIYTSGSTGKPKGAAVYHRGFFNLIAWFVKEFRLDAGDSNLLLTSPAFDLTQKNIFAPLVSGGTLNLPDGDYFDPAAILQTLGERKITWINCTPGMIYKIVQYSDGMGLERLSGLRYLFLGGEPIVMKMLARWVESPYFKAEIVNTYGPTECTDICAAYRVGEPRLFYERSVPIGSPVYNAQLFVLDTSFHPVPAGVPGELFIGGAGVGFGYIADSRLTAERFIILSIDGRAEMRLYRTGDQVKWLLPEGVIEFIGRLDQQVKIRGLK
jgi:amino acid adenylation domain-containing protein